MKRNTPIGIWSVVTGLLATVSSCDDLCTKEHSWTPVTCVQIDLTKDGNVNCSDSCFIAADGQQILEITVCDPGNNCLAPQEQCHLSVTNGTLIPLEGKWEDGAQSITVTQSQHVWKALLRTSTEPDEQVVLTARVNKIVEKKTLNYSMAHPTEMQLSAPVQTFSIVGISELTITARLFGHVSEGTRVDFSTDLTEDDPLFFHVSIPQTVAAVGNEATAMLKLTSIPDEATIADAPTTLKLYAKVNTSATDSLSILLTR